MRAFCFPAAADSTIALSGGASVAAGVNCNIVVRFTPTNLTADLYDGTTQKLEEAGVEFPPDGMDLHVCFGEKDNLRVSEEIRIHEKLLKQRRKENGEEEKPAQETPPKDAPAADRPDEDAVLGLPPGEAQAPQGLANTRQGHRTGPSQRQPGAAPLAARPEYRPDLAERLDPRHEPPDVDP